nr:AcvB/VirJ family lysyl-phosphatidylglycerol hydrolase [Pseudomonas bohemica]
MEHYRRVWGIKHFILAGYSFGADVLPALYNRLPAIDQADVDSIVLLSFARNANFEIRIEGMMGEDTGKYMTAPEMAQLPAKKVFCVYGTDEARKSGCTDTVTVGKTLGIPGNHHFNDDYDTLSTYLIDFMKRPL